MQMRRLLPWGALKARWSQAQFEQQVDRRTKLALECSLHLPEAVKTKPDQLWYGSPGDAAVRLCVDMQRMFSSRGSNSGRPSGEFRMPGSTTSFVTSSDILPDRQCGTLFGRKP